MKAFKAIYKKHSLLEQQDKLTVNDTLGSDILAPLNPHKMHGHTRHKDDPFMLRKCLADAGVVEKVDNSKTTKRKLVARMTLRSFKRQMHGNNTNNNNNRAGCKERSNISHRTVLPGNCTSYFSLR